MNWIDVIILCILVISLITGFKNGFIKEIVSLAALILGIWGSIRFSSFTAAKLYEWFDITGQYTGLISFIITFVVIVLLIHLSGKIIDKFLKAISLGFFNKLIGSVFNVLKSVLFLSIIFVILNTINEKTSFLPEKQIESSLLYNPISDFVPAIFPLIGEGSFSKSFDRIREKDSTGI